MKLSSEWAMVAGIDPGTKVVGYCLIAVRGQDLQLMTVGSFKTKGDTIEERLASMEATLTEKLPIGIRLAAVENGYVGRGARAALGVAMARGVAVVVAKKVSRKVRLVDPNSARKSVGAASYGAKRQEANDRVRRAVTRILGRSKLLGEDEAAAGALGVWAANRVWQDGAL